MAQENTTMEMDNMTMEMEMDNSTDVNNSTITP